MAPPGGALRPGGHTFQRLPRPRCSRPLPCVCRQQPPVVSQALSTAGIAEPGPDILEAAQEQELRTCRSNPSQVTADCPCQRLLSP